MQSICYDIFMTMYKATEHFLWKKNIIFTQEMRSYFLSLSLSLINIIYIIYIYGTSALLRAYHVIPVIFIVPIGTFHTTLLTHAYHVESYYRAYDPITVRWRYLTITTVYTASTHIYWRSHSKMNIICNICRNKYYIQKNQNLFAHASALWTLVNTYILYYVRGDILQRAVCYYRICALSRANSF